MVMQQLSMSLGISVGAYLLNKYGDLPWVDHTNSITVFPLYFPYHGRINGISQPYILSPKKLRWR